jgi:hypothetical protein
MLQKLQHHSWRKIDFLLKNLYTINVGYLPYNFRLLLLWILVPSLHFYLAHSFVEMGSAQCSSDSSLERTHWQEFIAIKTESVIS